MVIFIAGGAGGGTATTVEGVGNTSSSHLIAFLVTAVFAPGIFPLLILSGNVCYEREWLYLSELPSADGPRLCSRCSPSARSCW